MNGTSMSFCRPDRNSNIVTKKHARFQEKKPNYILAGAVNLWESFTGSVSLKWHFPNFIHFTAQLGVLNPCNSLRLRKWESNRNLRDDRISFEWIWYLPNSFLSAIGLTFLDVFQFTNHHLLSVLLSVICNCNVLTQFK